MIFDLNSVVVDFVVRTEDPETWRIVLVESGPWEDINQELYRVQDRLYKCVDNLIEGGLARKFPETRNKKILIQFDGYNLPEARFAEFYNSFSSRIFLIPDFAKALKESDSVKEITFSLNLQQY